MDLSSPYAYFAALEIEELAARHSRNVEWRPFLLGVAYQITGMKALTEQSLRGAYARHDWGRLARLRGTSFVLPDPFPLRTQVAARMVYSVEARDPDRAGTFTKGLLEAAFARGRDISRPEEAAEVGASLGLDRAALLAAAADQHWKNALRARNDEALGKGVFGSPFVIVDGEPFWGADRLPMVERWLEQGGW